MDVYLQWTSGINPAAALAANPVDKLSKYVWNGPLKHTCWVRPTTPRIHSP